MEKRLFTVIIILVAIGVTTELFKKFISVEPRSGTEVTSADLAAMDIRPYFISDSERQIRDIRARRAQRGGLMTVASDDSTFNEYDFGDSHKAAENINESGDNDEESDEEKRRKARGESDEEKEDEDKKKKEEDSEPQFIVENNKSAENKEASDTTKEDTPQGGAGLAGGPASAAPQTDNTNTFSEWAARLLGTPNRSELNEFIKLYQSGQINPDVFYGIVEAMLEESNPLFKEFAAIAVGATPSMASFEFLIFILKNEPSGSPAASIAQSSLFSYESLNYVGILSGVIGSTQLDITTIRFAAEILNDSTQRYLSAQEESGSENEESDTPNRTVPPATNPLNIFTGFIGPLSFAINAYQNVPEINAPLTEAFSRIQDQMVAGI